MDMDVSQLLRRSAARVAAKTALVISSTGATLTFAELDAEADRVASGLSRMGVTRGDRVALGMHNLPTSSSLISASCARARSWSLST